MRLYEGSIKAERGSRYHMQEAGAPAHLGTHFLTGTKVQTGTEVQILTQKVLLELGFTIADGLEYVRCATAGMRPTSVWGLKLLVYEALSY